MLRYEWNTVLDLRRRLIVISCALAACAITLLTMNQQLLAVTLLSSAAMTALLVPLATLIAERVGALCEPGGRSHHKLSTPLFGGVALFVPVLVILAWRAAVADPYLWGVLIGAVLMITVGLVDDVRSVRARTKLLVQILAGMVLVLFGAEIPALGLHGVGVLSTGWMAKPLVVILVVGISNAFNVVDGLDGLAATVGLIAAGTLALLGMHPLMTIALAGSCIGFLVFNLPRARVFLGDAGSLTLGFMLTAFALQLPSANNVPLAVALFAYPVGDMALAIVRRIIPGKPIMSPDGSHTHHKLRNHLGGTEAALMFVAAFVLVVTVVGVLRPSILFLALVVLAWVGLAAGIVFAGKYQMKTVLAARHPFRRMHAAYRYGIESVRLARDPEHILMAVRHAVEALGLSVRTMQLHTGAQIDARLIEDTPHSLPQAPADHAVERERENLLLDICRVATAQLENLDGPSVRSTRRRRRPSGSAAS